jgi:alpha-galactosidase
MRKSIVWLCLLAAPFTLSAAQSTFDPGQNTWTLTNGWIRATFQLSPDGFFLTQSLADIQTGDRWTASPNRPASPVRLQADSDLFDASRQFTLLDSSSVSIAPSGVRQSIVLLDQQGAAQITVIFEMYDDQPVLRYSLRYRNLTSATVHINWLNMLPWTFDDSGKRFTTFRVNQWSVLSKLQDFEPVQTALDPGGDSVEVYSGAHGQQCGWLAVRDSDMRGLFAGWEFDGRAKTTARQSGSQDYVEFASTVLDLNHPVAPFGEFTVPSSFVGLFHGDWDEAGYRTQRFVEGVLAKPVPDAKTFPYVSWDSWAYGKEINESTMRANAELAASLGVELFVVDLGWSRAIGDWYADETKFPNGLAAVSDYVHSLGMKFGLHFALAEADAASPVLQANPDWTSTENDNYFGASSLCLSHQPTKEWLVRQGIRIIDDYHVDWILQDGENMVKECTHTNHTHDPADSNYANAVDGINAVVAAIQQARPNVLWENCENGGNMMTFNMVKNYVTSITNDASGSLGSRRAVYGATYPFPPRFAERYMPDTDGLAPYATHSYMFGGPWVLQNRLPDLTPDQMGFLKEQIRNFKMQRSDIAAGKVFHIVAPEANGTDAIQSYNPATDNAVAVITRAASDGPSYTFKPKGLQESQRYTVWFEISPDVYSVTGDQLMRSGVRVALPTPYSSEIVHIESQQ